MEVGAFVAGQDASDASDASAAAPATAEVLVAGADGETVAGEVLYSDVGLSFWGGVCPESGTVIDARHPLAGQCITDKILCLPSGRGSCTGSQVVLELVLNGVGPRAILTREVDDIIALGGVVAEELLDAPPFRIVAVGAGFDALAALAGAVAEVAGDGSVSTGGDAIVAAAAAPPRAVATSAHDEALLAGARGPAAAAAMRIVLRVAAFQRAESLVTVERAHIDACTYIGPGGLRFAERLNEMGGRFCVPTTTNACSVDRGRWRELDVPDALGLPATRLADCYVALGAAPSFTCAPYLRDDAPARGEHLGYSESNAVVFVNSVSGARSQKYADYMDGCVALCGRAPHAGAHTDASRRATLVLDVGGLVAALDPESDLDGFFAALGYVVGAKAGARVPVVVGLESWPAVSLDDWKAFSAAFGTTAAAPLFHCRGQTPCEGLQDDLDGVETVSLTMGDVAAAWADLGGGGAGASDGPVDLVALGSPHFSGDELSRLAALVREDGGDRPTSSVLVTLSAEVLASREADAAALRAWGAGFVVDTCWCMLNDPVVPPPGGDRRVVTNSAKYAHYAPGLVGRRPHLAGLAACVEAARTGRVPRAAPHWLQHRAFSTALRILR